MRVGLTRTIALVCTAVVLISATPGASGTELPGFVVDRNAGTVVGSFVAFSHNDLTGELSDYRLLSRFGNEGDLVVFIQAKLENASRSEIIARREILFAVGQEMGPGLRFFPFMIAIDGFVAQLSLGMGEIKIIHTIASTEVPIRPVSYVNSSLPKDTVTFRLHPAIEASQDPEPREGVAPIRLRGPDFLGFVSAKPGEVRTDGKTITAEVEGDRLVDFRGLRLDGLSPERSEFESSMLEAVALGDVASRVTVTEGRTGLYFMSLTLPSPVGIRLESSSQNQISLDLESSQRTIIVADLPPEIFFPADVPKILLNGARPRDLRTLDELLGAASDGETEPLTHVFRDGLGLTLSVWLPGAGDWLLSVEVLVPWFLGAFYGIPLWLLLVTVIVSAAFLGTWLRLKRRR